MALYSIDYYSCVRKKVIIIYRFAVSSDTTSCLSFRFSPRLWFMLTDVNRINANITDRKYKERAIGFECLFPPFARSRRDACIVNFVVQLEWPLQDLISIKVYINCTRRRALGNSEKVLVVMSLTKGEITATIQTKKKKNSLHSIRKRKLLWKNDRLH